MQTVTVPTLAHVALATDPQPGTRQGYNAAVSKCLGATQIGIGATLIVLQIVAIGIQAGLYQVCHGIWCGIFFIIAGTFGVAAGNTKRTCIIITFMTLSIIAAALFMCPLIACAALGLHFDHSPYRYNYYESLVGARQWMNGLMIGLALLEGIIAIFSSLICCRPLCCPGTTTGTAYAQMQYNPTTGQQTVVLAMPSGGQPMTPYGVHGASAVPQYVMQPTICTAQPDKQMETQPAGNPNPPPAYNQQVAAQSTDHAPVHTACSNQNHGAPPPYNSLQQQDNKMADF